MPRPADWPVAPIARRYRAVEELGRGGQGRVYAAIDELTGGRVAVKLVPRGSGDVAAQREIAVLRALRLPGVARLLDQGRDGDDRYLVTELVDGRPFPGLPRPAPWEVVAGATRQLLRGLSQVHHAGVVHGDLKPGNVLVTGGGKVRLLDFGLAHAHVASVRDAASAPVGGTLHYVAPEVIGGQRPDHRADLFALGVLLLRSLTDGLPWEGDSIAALVQARSQHRAHLPSHFDVAVPTQVEDTLGALLELDPAARPASCQEVMGLLGLDLGGPAAPTPWSDTGPPLEPGDLAVLFLGHERILHVPSDAAAVLHTRTDGDRGRIQEELQRWVGQGLAEVEGGYLRVDRAVIAHLRQAAGSAGEQSDAGWRPLGHRLAGDATTAEVVEAAKMLTWLSLEEGRLDDTMAAAELAFAVLREAPHPGRAVVPLLGHYARAAVATGSPRTLERAAWELRRLPAIPSREAFAAVVDAMRLAILGHATEALEIAVSLPSLGDEPVSALVPTVQIQAAHELPVEAEAYIYQQVRAWVQEQDTDTARAREAFWLGHLRRRQGRLAEAAALFAHAAQDHPESSTRLQACIERARALLAMGDSTRARRVARRTKDAAAQARDANSEALAWWLLRDIARRQGSAVGPDADLVDAVHHLGEPLLAGRVALVEAAIAWSGGYPDAAGALAMRARAAFHAASHQPEAALAAALAAAAGDAAGLWWAREHFPAPGDPDQAAVLLQAAALMAKATGLDAWSERARDLAATVDRTRVGEVLSPADALILAGLDPTEL